MTIRDIITKYKGYHFRVIKLGDNKHIITAKIWINMLDENIHSFTISGRTVIIYI